MKFGLSIFFKGEGVRKRERVCVCALEPLWTMHVYNNSTHCWLCWTRLMKLVLMWYKQCCFMLSWNRKCACVYIILCDTVWYFIGEKHCIVVCHLVTEVVFGLISLHINQTWEAFYNHHLYNSNIFLVSYFVILEPSVLIFLCVTGKNVFALSKICLVFYSNKT